MIIEFLTELGFKKFDIALLIFCPIGAVVGSFAHSILVSIDPYSPPTNPTKNYRASTHLALARGAWLHLRLALGAILGLVIALYFVGALQENLTTLTKITALSILIGYCAPKIWLSQEQVLSKRVGELISQELKKHEKIEP